MRRGPLVVSMLVAAASIAGASPSHAHLTLETLVGAGYLEVTLDTSRFYEGQVATIRIVNPSDLPYEGEIPACLTVFEPRDPGLSLLTPRESGPFRVGPHQTIQLTRPFRLLEPTRRPPGGGGYELSDHPLFHDLSRCPG